MQYCLCDRLDCVSEGAEALAHCDQVPPPTLGVYMCFLMWQIIAFAEGTGKHDLGMTSFLPLQHIVCCMPDSTRYALSDLWYSIVCNYVDFMMSQGRTSRHPCQETGSPLDMKRLSYTRALVYYINRKQKKICIGSVMEKYLKVIGCSEQHIVLATIWPWRSTLVNLSRSRSCPGWSEPYSERLISTSRVGIASSGLEIRSTFCFFGTLHVTMESHQSLTRALYAKLSRRFFLDRH